MKLKSKINSKSSVQSQESQSINTNKISEEIDNESNKENEIIFTIELNDFFNMLGLLLCDNKDNPISISIDNNFFTKSFISLLQFLYQLIIIYHK